MSTTTKRYRKLGFDKTEAATLVEALNQLLANYHLHYQKLRNFHWNVKGADFFDLHEQFEERYNISKESIDEIAERIRTFGHTPLSNLSDYMKLSTIKESKSDLAAEKMVQEILKDYEILLSFLTDAMNAAIDMGDVGTQDMLNTLIQDMEKHHWMLSSFLGK
jgi:starvation-inducible DNA-binding protein